MKEQAIAAIVGTLNQDSTFGHGFTREDVENWFNSSPKIEHTEEEYELITRNPYFTAALFLFDRRKRI